MIKNIIFDFGDIFINLDKEALFNHMTTYGITELSPEMYIITKDYEKGLISSQDFIAGLRKMLPKSDSKSLTIAWNNIILDFPEYRLEFIEKLKSENQYRLFLLSNTNELHIDFIKEQMGALKYGRFQNCFEVFYLSYKMKMRKPDIEIFEFVLKENNLNPEQTLFVDDTKENTESAAQLGIQTWNLKVGKEEISSLTFRLT